MPRLVACLVAVAAIFGTAALASAAPRSIEAQRAEVAAIERELASIDSRVGHAAEAYNGARWRMGQVQQRIAANRRDLSRAQRDLTASRRALVDRVRKLYREGDPSTIEIVLASESVGSALDQANLLRRIETQDARVVSDIRAFRERVKQARVQLIADRRQARREVAERLKARQRVEALLRRRQAVLSRARGDLGRMLAAQRAAERRQAEISRRRAVAAQQSTSQAGAVIASGPLPSGTGNASAASVAMQYLGVPYVWGGASPSGFDCSGLASYAYAQIGKSVPHYTGAIWAAFPKVPSDQLQAGDLVFYNGLGHMGIYIGNGQYVHAPHTGDVVKVSSMSDRGDYVGAVRP